MYAPRNPDEWLFVDWTLITSALRDAKYTDCRCHQCDTLDSLLADIAHYWDLQEHELVNVEA